MPGLEPRRQKYRRTFRGKMRGKAYRGNRLVFGDFGLKSEGVGWVSSQQLEAARQAIRRFSKRKGMLWIRVFPDKPVTKKPPEVRMGSGKGLLDHYVVVVRPGMIIFEISGIEKEMAQKVMRLASSKLSVPTRFVVREEV